MELGDEQDFLEELVSPRIESWNNSFAISGVKEFFPNAWNPTFYQENNPEFIASNNSSLLGLMTMMSPSPDFQESNFPFLDSFTSTCTHQVMDSSSTYNYIQERATSVEQEAADLISTDHFIFGQQDQDSLISTSCFNINNKVVKMEEATSRIVATQGEKKSSSKVKKVEGQPSKNLMAERRRRKRLNDRLSMLRSIVPKISKMDRTSILGDTIDYVKELLDKINRMREEHELEDEIKDIKFIGNFKELKPNEAIVRNPPKFDVERRNEEETNIEICCATKPGLLLSTISTMEALGLEVQQCAVSCFSDFSMRASCSEVPEHRTILGSEDVKQALFKTAGYGGRCV